MVAYVERYHLHHGSVLPIGLSVGLGVISDCKNFVDSDHLEDHSEELRRKLQSVVPEDSFEGPLFKYTILDERPWKCISVGTPERYRLHELSKPIRDNQEK